MARNINQPSPASRNLLWQPIVPQSVKKFPELYNLCVTFSSPCRRIIEVQRSHTETHRVRFLWTSDQFVAQAATYTTHNKDMTQTSMPPAELEPEIPQSERPQTYALDRAATGICPRPVWYPKFLYSDQAVCKLPFFWYFIPKYCMHSSCARRDRGNVSSNDKYAFKVRRQLHVSR